LQAPTSISRSLINLWEHISPRRKKQFFLLTVLIVVASLTEIISIGAVLPFLAALTDPDKVFQLPLAQPLIQALNITSSNQLLLPLTIAFGFAAILAGVMRLLLLWTSTRLSFATGADLSYDIYLRTLHQDYEVHIARNSSIVIDGILNKPSIVIYEIVMPILNFISSLIMLIVILIGLVFVDAATAAISFSGFGIIYIVVVLISRNRLQINSESIARESSSVIKSLQEGLGGIRDVLIDGSQKTYLRIFQGSDSQLRRAQGDNAFITAGPRFAIEALGMLLIAVLAYYLSQQMDGFSKAIPILGAFALGAQRLFPNLQQVYASWAKIKGGQASLKDALYLLNQPMPKQVDEFVKPMAFHSAIHLDHLSFRYQTDAPWVLRNINLTIPKGSRIGFIGTTGCGKSTLLDIVMGLLKPIEGALKVDDTSIDVVNRRAWQANIAHVPQTIFLADSTIAENIAFGVPKDQIDLDRVRQAAAQAQVAQIIEAWPEQYNSFVGERGVRLSGGQRQRIGIARALYKKADVIIFDEATSALDNETEESVIEAIENLRSDITILIIAHRLTTLRNCTQIIELGNQGIQRTLSYDQIDLESE
jgi:ABC-type multidrug transport system fused ATPase/permease subunit